MPEIGRGLTLFSILYLITFIPCWIILILIIFYWFKKNYRSLFYLIPIFVLIYLLPFIYLFLSLNSVAWVFKLVVIGVPVLFLVRLLVLKDKTKYFWDMYACVYDILNRFEPYKILISTLANEIKDSKKEGLILDFGCGTGNLIKELSKYNKYQIIGIDSSHSMIKRANKKLKKFSNIKLIYRDVKNINNIITHKFDLIVINNVLYTIENPKNVLQNLALLLKNDGLIMISEPEKQSSILQLINSDFKKRKNVFFYIVYFFPLLLLLLFNVVISTMESGKKFVHFFTKEELINMLSGYNILKIAKIYENQNILIKAAKQI